MPTSQKTKPTEKRVCPKCYQLAKINIVQDGEWELWHCPKCGRGTGYRTG